MNDITLYYDFIENDNIPKWLIISNIDWTRKTLYLSLNSIMHREGIANFINDNLSVSVLLSDLIMNSSYKDHFGINLSNIERRIRDYGLNIEEIDYLIIRTVDIKQVINMIN